MALTRSLVCIPGAPTLSLPGEAVTKGHRLVQAQEPREYLRAARPTHCVACGHAPGNGWSCTRVRVQIKTVTAVRNAGKGGCKNKATHRPVHPVVALERDPIQGFRVRVRVSVQQCVAFCVCPSLFTPCE